MLDTIQKRKVKRFSAKELETLKMVARSTPEPDELLLIVWESVLGLRSLNDYAGVINPADYAIPREQALAILEGVPESRRSRANLLWLNIGPASVETGGSL